jgi:hypothetical protein
MEWLVSGVYALVALPRWYLGGVFTSGFLFYYFCEVVKVRLIKYYFI